MQQGRDFWHAERALADELRVIHAIDDSTKVGLCLCTLRVRIDNQRLTDVGKTPPQQLELFEAENSREFKTHDLDYPFLAS